MLPKGEKLQLIYRCKSDAYEFELLSWVALGTNGSNCAPWMNDWTKRDTVHSLSDKWDLIRFLFSVEINKRTVVLSAIVLWQQTYLDYCIYLVCIKKLCVWRRITIMEPLQMVFYRETMVYLLSKFWCAFDLIKNYQKICTDQINKIILYKNLVVKNLTLWFHKKYNVKLHQKQLSKLILLYVIVIKYHSTRYFSRTPFLNMAI